jgi:uncharacterized protein YecE (DUF72 family)
MNGQVRVGISGWRYGPWREVFYPPDLRQKDELKYASRHVGIIEINGTFYSLQRPSSFLQWKEETPENFIFAVKGSRYITHMLKLNHPREGLANFFASGVLALGEKLGPILWQLPPNLGFHADKVEAFLQALPTSGEEAAEVGRRHDHRLKAEAWLNHDGVTRIRHAMEVRHESFCCPEFLALLRKYKVASVVSDSAQRFPVIEDVTSNFVYVRLHGHKHLYSGGYPLKLLKEWAARIKLWQSGKQAPGKTGLIDENHKLRKAKRDVFVFFDNDAKVDAPRDAVKLEKILKSQAGD